MSSPKHTSSVLDDASAPPFGGRLLTDPALVFTRNAWDHVQPPAAEHAARVKKAEDTQRAHPVERERAEKVARTPARFWDEFYKANRENFFRDRKWLHLEFPELVEATKPDAGDKTIVEIGCGAGNTLFPLLSVNKNPRLHLRGYDYSPHAVRLVQNNPQYLHPSTVGSIHAAVWDLAGSRPPPGLQLGSADAVLLVFVLSALAPREWARAVEHVWRMLKPGGVLLLRDYGRHDLAQLRFGRGRLVPGEENLYIRGDGTRVYFFHLDELSRLFTGSSLPSSSPSTSLFSDASRTTNRVAGGSTVLKVDAGADAGLDGDARVKEGEERDAGGIVDADSDGGRAGSERREALGDATVDDETVEVYPVELNVDGHGDLKEHTEELDSASVPPRQTALKPERKASAAVELEPSPELISGSQCREDSSSLAASSPLSPSTSNPQPYADPRLPPHPLFCAAQLGADRRLLVNRARKLVMYRVWVQARMVKVGSGESLRVEGVDRHEERRN